MVNLIIEHSQPIPDDSWCGPWDDKVLDEYLTSNNLILLCDFQDLNYTIRKHREKYQIGVHVASTTQINNDTWTNQEHIVLEGSNIEEVVEIITNSKYSKHFHLKHMYKNDDELRGALKALYREN